MVQSTKHLDLKPYYALKIHEHDEYLTQSDVIDFVTQLAENFGKVLSISIDEDTGDLWIDDDGFDYYTIDEAIEHFSITVEQLSTPTEGYLASYRVKQGGQQVGSLINVPKDSFLRAASIETVGANPTTIEQNNNLTTGDKYFKFEVGVANNNVTTLIMPANDMFNIYTADETTIHLDSNNVFSVKPNVFADKSHSHNEYLTEHQSLANYVTNTELNTILSSYVLSNTLNGYYTSQESDDRYAPIAHVHSQYLVEQDIENKVDKATGMGLSSNDFTDAYKNAIDNLSTTIATAIGNLELIRVVNELPVANIKQNVFYAIRNSSNETNNLFNFFIYVNNDWEQIDLNLNITNVIQKSQTLGLVKNDGTIDQNTYATMSDISDFITADDLNGNIDLTAYIQKSQTSGLVTNDGTIDTKQYLDTNQQSHSNKNVIVNSNGEIDFEDKPVNPNYGYIDDNFNLNLLYLEITNLNYTVAPDDSYSFTASIEDELGNGLEGIYVDFFSQFEGGEEHLIETVTTNSNGIASIASVPIANNIQIIARVSDTIEKRITIED